MILRIYWILVNEFEWKCDIFLKIWVSPVFFRSERSYVKRSHYPRRTTALQKDFQSKLCPVSFRIANVGGNGRFYMQDTVKSIKKRTRIRGRGVSKKARWCRGWSDHLLSCLPLCTFIKILFIYWVFWNHLAVNRAPFPRMKYFLFFASEALGPSAACEKRSRFLFGLFPHVEQGVTRRMRIRICFLKRVFYPFAV